MIYYTPNGKIAGEMKNGFYLKRVNRKKHLMKIFNGYGVSTSILEKLKKDGCKEIRIKEDTGNLYYTPFEVFLEKGIVKNFDDPQMFCSLTHFKVKNDKQLELL